MRVLTKEFDIALFIESNIIGLQEYKDNEAG